MVWIMKRNHVTTGTILVFVAAVVLLLLCASVFAQVPPACRQFQRLVTSEAHNVLGLDAPVPILAAQIQQESSCNPSARSAYAYGLTQFTPGTAGDMAARYKVLRPADPGNPRWAVMAQVRYMGDLLSQFVGRTECDSWAFALSSYNGGAGWARRDQRLCLAQPVEADCNICIVDRWFGNVELYSSRSHAAFIENRGYPRRILLQLAPRYARAGYGRSVQCSLP